MPEETNDKEAPGRILRNVKIINEPAQGPAVEPPKKIVKVVTGAVTKRKKSLGEKITNVFFGEEAKSIARFVIWDVLVPNAKDLFVEMVNSALNMRLYGEDKPTRGLRRDRDRTSINYGGFSRERGFGRREREEPERRSRAVFAFQDVVIARKGDAEKVLAEMADVIDQYGVVSILDLCDMLDIQSEHTDQKWGWRTVGSAYTERVRDGYILVLPRPIELD
jgi:hypothetical protein